MSETIAQVISGSQGQGYTRMLIGAILGLLITLSLFWMMQAMIEMADNELDDSNSGQLVDFVRLKRDESTRRREIKPRKPPPPDQPPPEPPTPRLDDAKASADKIAVTAAPVETSIDLTGGFSIGNIGEGEYLPIVKVAPVYPPRAAQRGVEGFCVVEYTVTRNGTTRDPRVVDSQCTSSLFHRASIQASLKFKYKPRVRNGEAIEVAGVRNKFTYVLED